MRLRKTIVIALSIITFLVILYFLLLWNVGRAYKDIGESLIVPAKPIKTVSLGPDEYILFFSPGAAFTSREWWVNKNGKLIYRITSHDGQVDDIQIKNGKPYLIGSGVDNVDLSKESNK